MTENAIELNCRERACWRYLILFYESENVQVMVIRVLY